MKEPKPDLYVKDIDGNYHRYEQEQSEPVAIVGMANTVVFKKLPIGTKLYAHPQPKREWVGLTDAEIRYLQLFDVADTDYARAIEAKLKEKNTQHEPLTRDELWKLWCNAKAESEYLFWWEFARAIEAAHGIGKEQA